MMTVLEQSNSTWYYFLVALRKTFLDFKIVFFIHYLQCKSIMTLLFLPTIHNCYVEARTTSFIDSLDVSSNVKKTRKFEPIVVKESLKRSIMMRCAEFYSQMQTVYNVKGSYLFLPWDSSSIIVANEH